MLATIQLGELLALQPDRDDEALHMCEEATRMINELHPGPDDIIGSPETILVLLKGSKAAVPALTQRLKSGTPPLRRSMLEFLMDRHIAPKSLLTAIDEDSRDDRAMIHRLIAVRHLGCSEVTEARRQLEASLHANYWLPDSRWAHAFFTQLSSDEAATRPLIRH